MNKIETACQLTSFWREFRCERPPYFHPDDKATLMKYGRFENRPWSFQKFVHDRRFYDDAGFHLSLLPVPFLGNIKSARIFILLLNPGFEPIDYFSEASLTGYRRVLRDSVHQAYDRTQYPFWPLDPELSWTGGGRWWWSKLGAIAKEFANRKFGGDVRHAVSEMARQLASIELVAYHSKRFSGGRRFIRDLASAQAAIGFARGEMLQRAQAGDATVVVTRQCQLWGLKNLNRKKSGGVVTYSGGECRGASLGPNTRGGRAMLKALLSE